MGIFGLYSAVTGEVPVLKKKRLFSEADKNEDDTPPDDNESTGGDNGDSDEITHDNVDAKQSDMDNDFNDMYGDESDDPNNSIDTGVDGENGGMSTDGDNTGGDDNFDMTTDEFNQNMDGSTPVEDLTGDDEAKRKKTTNEKLTELYDTYTGYVTQIKGMDLPIDVDTAVKPYIEEADRVLDLLYKYISRFTSTDTSYVQIKEFMQYKALLVMIFNQIKVLVDKFDLDPS